MTTALATRLCSIDGCERDYLARGWCRLHYSRWRNHGSTDPLRTTTSMSLDDRLRFHGWTERADGCWVWRGPRHHTGYGVLYVEGSEMQAHRAAYEVWVGPIPEGRVVRHSCDNGGEGCMNPSHLLPGTRGDNAQDMVDRLRFHKKLTPDEVRDIRGRLASGENQRLMALDYGVTQQTISRINTGESWAHLQ
jgi:hypothetical protein